MWIEVDITADMRVRAETRAKAMGAINHSILKGKGNITGFIGEEVVAHLLGIPPSDTFDYDFVKNGVKFDVKTKWRNVPPQPHYTCSVEQRQIHIHKQDCHAYIFVSTDKSYTKAWVIGVLSKQEFLKLADTVPEGTFDPANQWSCSRDCFSVRMDEVRPLHF